MTEKRPLEPRDLYRMRINTDPQITSDGHRIAFVQTYLDEEKNDYVSNIFLAEDGTVRQFTSGDKDSNPRWSPDGRQLAFVSKRGEKAQLFLMPADGGEATALTEQTLGAGEPVWSPDGTAIAFIAPTSTTPEAEETKDDKKPAATKIVDRASYKSDGKGYVGNRRSHVFLVTLEDKQVRQLTEGDFSDAGLSWSPDGQHLAFASNRTQRWDVSTEEDIYLIPSTGGEGRRLTSGHTFGTPRFSPDGSRIAVVGRENPDEIFFPARIYSVDRSGGDLRDELGDWDGGLGNEVMSDILNDEHQTAMDWFSDGIYFIGTERGQSNVYRAADGRVCPVTSGAHAITGFSVAADGTVAYTCADATHPADVFLLRDGQVTQVTHSNDWLDDVRVIVPERLSYTGPNGEEGEGWLLAPPGHESGKHPLLVYINGGPQTAHGEAFFFEYQYLANQGFGVFFPNIHGSSSYGRDYQISIHGRWGSIDYQDVMAGTDAALDRSWVDPARVGIIGGSYGGYMTSWTIGHTGRFRAAVVERCLSNMVSFMGTSDGGWVWNRSFGVYPEDDVQKLWSMSPIAYVKNVRTPTLVMHSERDDRTPLEQGEQYFNALRRLGVDTRFIVFPEESHGLSRGGKPSRRIERMEHIRDWFREHL